MVISLQQESIASHLRPILEAVSDPEIPVLSVLDLGIVRSATEENGVVHVKITPTYSGCPATDVIGSDIKKALENAGYTVSIESVLEPAWTTDWISEGGRKKLEAYGIASPLEESADKAALLQNVGLVPCPQCGSRNTIMVSQFGSTACKALFKCNDCLEPFDYFKCLR
ncbi:MAG: 1,2-phenylacetyl-CoA epoxidase subunit PaaD [Bacteroidia bacterium]|jgi:ring-1,2-phenylacetyl-CoA epoxidase subunit PaaD